MIKDVFFYVGLGELEGGRLSEREKEGESLFYVDGPKTEKEPAPRVDSLDREMWRVKVAQRSSGGCVMVCRDGHSQRV